MLLLAGFVAVFLVLTFGFALCRLSFLLLLLLWFSNSYFDSSYLCSSPLFCSSASLFLSSSLCSLTNVSWDVQFSSEKWEVSWMLVTHEPALTTLKNGLKTTMVGNKYAPQKTGWKNGLLQPPYRYGMWGDCIGYILACLTYTSLQIRCPRSWGSLGTRKGTLPCFWRISLKCSIDRGGSLWGNIFQGMHS